jgi:uncharacterized protein YeaO (DUF488 family)
MLLTKSIQEKSEKTDGIRICIMRRIKPEFAFDMWLQLLSPSAELLKRYHDEEISWEKFEALLTEEVLKTQTKFLEIVADLASKQDVTLLCWEETPEKCHRRLVAQWIVARHPEVKLTLN